MSDFQTECKYCYDMVTLSERSGKWLPYDDDEIHHCEERPSNNSFVKSCRYCSETIELIKTEDNRWRPFNENGSKHYCKRDNNATNRSASQ